MSMTFTYDGYIELLKKLSKAGYRLTSFLREEPTSGRQVILRHDVDLSPKKALMMAEVEHGEGVHSTYFFMLSSEWYNLLERENEEALQEIKDMGHEIGLHFDYSKYDPCEDEELRGFVLNEIMLLSRIVSLPVRAISWHIPDNRIVGKKLAFLDDTWVKNAYDPAYFSGYKYLSDSTMRWREDPLKHIDPDRFPKLQILTHPVWYSDTVQTRKEILTVELGKHCVSSLRYLEVIDPELIFE